MTDLLVTCEHASNEVPVRYRPLFAGAEGVLAGHRGWDPGALELARGLARHLRAPLFVGRVSRLVVELNRSPDHPDLFSRWTRRLPPPEREAILDAHYWPFRSAVAATVERAMRAGRDVLHLGVHTFTPVWRGRVRATDIGLLYDPRRPLEREWARGLKESLVVRLPGLAVHFNRPYRGWTDGHTTSLRGRFAGTGLPGAPGMTDASRLGPGRYGGLELEVSQGLVRDPDPVRPDLPAGIIGALRDVLAASIPSGTSIAPAPASEEIRSTRRIP